MELESFTSSYAPSDNVSISNVGKPQAAESENGSPRPANSTEAKADSLVKNSLPHETTMGDSNVTVITRDNAEYLHQAVDEGMRLQTEGGQNVAKNAAHVVQDNKESMFDYDEGSSEDPVVVVAPGDYEIDTNFDYDEGSSEIVVYDDPGSNDIDTDFDYDEGSSEIVVYDDPDSYNIDKNVRADESNKTVAAMRKNDQMVEVGEPGALGKAAPQSKVHTGLKGIYMGIKQRFNNFIQRERVEKAGGNISEEVLKDLVRNCMGSNTKLKALGNALQGRAEQVGKERVDALLQGKIPSWVPAGKPESSSFKAKQEVAKNLSTIDDQKLMLRDDFKLGFRNDKFVFDEANKEGATQFMQLIKDGVALGVTNIDEYQINSLQSICKQWSTSEWAKDNLSNEDRLYLAKAYAESALEQLETRVNDQFNPILELDRAMQSVVKELGNTKLSEQGNTIKYDWSRQFNAYKIAEKSRPAIEKLKTALNLHTPEEIIDTFDMDKNPAYASMYRKVSDAGVLIQELKSTGKFARDVFKLYVGDNQAQQSAIDDFYNNKDWMGLNKFMLDLVKERNASK